jgi:hypothetical protein
MQTLKQWAVACVGAVALAGSGTGVATAADIPAQPYYQPADAPGPQYAPQYVPGPVEGAYPPPPVVYGYARPPVVYYDAPPVVVVPGPAYPRRYVYGYVPYPRYHGYYGYRAHVARGYGYRYGRHGRR